MKIFLSWSGPESLAMASALQNALPRIIQDVETFLSSEDIRKGARWHEEIGSQLEVTDFGILCLTPTNLTAPWLLFEAGALSKKVTQNAHVVPLLAWELSPSALTPPLSNFQTTTVAKADVLRLLKTINGLLKKPLIEGTLIDTFEAFWPKLEAGFAEAKKLRTTMPAAAKRTPEDISHETLALVRTIAFKLAEIGANSQSNYVGLANLMGFGDDGTGAVAAPPGGFAFSNKSPPLTGAVPIFGITGSTSGPPALGYPVGVVVPGFSSAAAVARAHGVNFPSPSSGDVTSKSG